MALDPELFTSTVPDIVDPTLVQGSHWNAVVDLLEEVFDGAVGARTMILSAGTFSLPSLAIVDASLGLYKNATGTLGITGTALLMGNASFPFGLTSGAVFSLAGNNVGGFHRSDAGEGRFTLITTDGKATLQFINPHLTAGVPVPLPTETAIGHISFRGAVSSTGFNAAGTISFELFTTEQWSTTAQGSRLELNLIKTGTTTSYVALRVESVNGAVFSGSGVTNATYALQAKDSAGNPLLVVRNDGGVGIGTAAPFTGYTLDVNGGVHFTTSIILQERFGGQSSHTFARSNGTSGSPTIVASENVVGAIYFQGYDGTALRLLAGIEAIVDGIPSANDMPGRLNFYTTPDGSITAVERMRITGTGSVGIATTSPTDHLTIGNQTGAVYALHFRGDNNALTTYPGIRSGGNGSIIIEANATAGGRVYLGADNAAEISIGAGGGNVGIGTLDPGSALDVAGSTVRLISNPATLIIGGFAGSTVVSFINDGVAPRLVSASGLTFSIGIFGLNLNTVTTWEATNNLNVGSGKLYVDVVNSRVGIGTTTPTSGFVLDVVGGLRLTTLTLTSSPGLTLQRLNDNSNQILAQSTVPPEGRTHEAPFMWFQSGATFNGEWDPVLYFGYNADRGVSTEPTVRWVIEGNYNHGPRDVEFYWEYLDRSNLAGATAWRPIFITADKDSLANKSLTFISTGVWFDGYTAAPLVLNMRPKNANQPVTVIVGGGNGTGNGSNQIFTIAAGTDQTTAASLILQGITSTNTGYYGDKGAACLVAGPVSSPTAASKQGAVVLMTGPTAGSPVERVRVEQAGNVALNKPGVAATALLHLGAGSAAASSAPLKFTSGTNMTTAEAGAFEYNGTNLFFTRTGTTREGVLSASAVTSESLTADRSVTVNIDGTTYKLLAKA